jgi:hypothetical protein
VSFKVPPGAAEGWTRIHPTVTLDKGTTSIARFAYDIQADSLPNLTISISATSIPRQSDATSAVTVEVLASMLEEMYNQQVLRAKSNGLNKGEIRHKSELIDAGGMKWSYRSSVNPPRYNRGLDEYSIPLEGHWYLSVAVVYPIYRESDVDSCRAMMKKVLETVTIK